MRLFRASLDGKIPAASCHLNFLPPPNTGKKRQLGLPHHPSDDVGAFSAQPGGLPDGSRGSERSGDPRIAVREFPSTPKAVADLWHPSRTKTLSKSVTGVFATLQPPATLCQPSALGGERKVIPPAGLVAQTFPPPRRRPKTPFGAWETPVDHASRKRTPGIDRPDSFLNSAAPPPPKTPLWGGIFVETRPGSFLLLFFSGAVGAIRPVDDPGSRR